MPAMRTAVSSVLLVLALAACGGAGTAPAAPPATKPDAPPPGAASSASRPVGDRALLDDDATRAALATMEKTPFTAAQIQAATRPGRTYTWAVERADGPPLRRVIRFTAVDAERATFVAETADADGKNPKTDPPEQATWEELRQHAEFPRLFVKVTEERLVVPAGTFDCLVYTVTATTREGAAETLTFWFARELPGPPVKLTVMKDGKLARSQVLTSHVPGG